MEIGDYVELENFGAVKKFEAATTLRDGTYTLNSLRELGIINGGQFVGHRYSANVYSGITSFV